MNPWFYTPFICRIFYLPVEFLNIRKGGENMNEKIKLMNDSLDNFKYEVESILESSPLITVKKKKFCL